MKHSVALAREQGVDVDAALLRQLLEAATFEFVGDEDGALLLGQLCEGKIELIEKCVADVERFGSVVGRWKQIFDLQRIALVVSKSSVGEEFRLFLAEQVSDAIARHAEEPRGD